MSAPQIIIDYALTLAGLPYKWGGDDPIRGFDCSGFCIEILQASGVWPRGQDASAQGIRTYYHSQGVIGKRGRGSLSFYGKSTSLITHVAFHLNRYHIIEAGGGGSTTITLDDAAEQNAYIRIRPFDWRKDYLETIMPMYPILIEDDG
jgi:cell wall-associated NlpC family hydrolase